MTVPQVGHLPLMALRPFFIVSSTASLISFLALHLTQYPSGIKFYRPAHHAPDGESRLTARNHKRNPEKETARSSCPSAGWLNCYRTVLEKLSEAGKSQRS